MPDNSSLIEQDIHSYLKQHEQKELLRFITCGSVDDGKSTLIGRLLHDSKMIFEDQLAAISQDSKKVGTQGDKVDLALLVDGLQSEREQGITIDVAYRYFSTDKRKFIIADTPGHEQYTRNMATGASTSDLAIILIDAQKGVQTQTKRHSFICSLLGIKSVIVAVNKMDKVEFSQKRYKDIQQAYLQFAGSLDIPNIRFVPISALEGDNVVNPSENLKWFRGSTLLQYLERAELPFHQETQDFRFPVQLVCRPNENFRGYQGSIVSGEIKVGETIRVLPSNTISTIKSIVTFDGEIAYAKAPAAVTLTLNDEVDVSRGNCIVKKDAFPHIASRLRATVIWMRDVSLRPYRQYLFKFASKVTPGEIDQIHHRIDVNTMEESPADVLNLNEIGTVDISLEEAVVFDAYSKNKHTGGFIIIDKETNQTLAAGLVLNPLVAQSEQTKEQVYLSSFERELIELLRKHFPELHNKV